MGVVDMVEVWRQVGGCGGGGHHFHLLHWPWPCPPPHFVPSSSLLSPIPRPLSSSSSLTSPCSQCLVIDEGCMAAFAVHMASLSSSRCRVVVCGRCQHGRGVG